MPISSILGRRARPLALALASASLLAAAPLAQARDNVFWSLGVVAAPGVSVGVSNAPPVYVQPAPIYVQPAPVVVQAPPRYVVPAPVYYGPPQVVYTQPQVIYGGPPVYGTAWVPPGHRHRHHRKHWD